MYHIGQFLLSLLPLFSGRLHEWPRPYPPPLDNFHVVHNPAHVTKSIAIVGAGSAGLAALKTILDLPEDVREGWEVLLFEQNRGIGGLWLADPPGSLPGPPELPESPVYPLLHTNTPHPTMTYPHFPFRPHTELFPFWDAVQQYHADFAEHFNLTSHILVNHTVHFADWHGDASGGDWHVEVHAHGADPNEKVVLRRTFDHIIVGNGHNHYPHIPHWPGEDGWLAYAPPGAPLRELIHSIYYRRPEEYANKTVVVVGAGSSARDISLQVGAVARVAYQSVHNTSSTAPGANVIRKPPISHFTDRSVFFEDGSELSDVDAILLGTGYEFRVPFLSAPHSSVLITDPSTTATSSTAETLTTNLRYIFPLYQHIFNLSPRLPATALAFIGLPVLIANCPSDYAQGIYVAHAIANASLLPSREEMFDDLLAREDLLRSRGYDPYYVGHRLVDGDTEAADYQDRLVEYLKQKGVILEDGKKYVEQWRRRARQQSDLLRRGWLRVQEQGEADQWLEGVQTEDEWADLMHRLEEWEKNWEEGQDPAAVAASVARIQEVLESNPSLS